MKPLGVGVGVAVGTVGVAVGVAGTGVGGTVVGITVGGTSVGVDGFVGSGLGGSLVGEGSTSALATTLASGVGISSFGVPPPQAPTTASSKHPSISSAVCLIAVSITLPLGAVYTQGQGGLGLRRRGWVAARATRMAGE